MKAGYMSSCWSAGEGDVDDEIGLYPWKGPSRRLMSIRGHFKSKDQFDDMVLRITACLNACEGLHTHSLEKAGSIEKLLKGRVDRLPAPDLRCELVEKENARLRQELEKTRGELKQAGLLLDKYWMIRLDSSGQLMLSDKNRANLEALVYLALERDEPIISISRGRELLGFEYMDDMRVWLKEYRENHA